MLYSINPFSWYKSRAFEVIFAAMKRQYIALPQIPVLPILNVWLGDFTGCCDSPPILESGGTYLWFLLNVRKTTGLSESPHRWRRISEAFKLNAVL